jgi:hypothetical protein
LLSRFVKANAYNNERLTSIGLGGKHVFLSFFFFLKDGLFVSRIARYSMTFGAGDASEGIL